MTNAAESGSCSDSDVFAIYASQSRRDAQIAQTRANNQTLKDAGLSTSIVLFGPNWSINIADQSVADQMQAALGGVETK